MGASVCVRVRKSLSQNITDKQRVLTPGHQGWNELHSLCRIGMEYYLLDDDDDDDDDDNRNNNNNENDYNHNNDTNNDNNENDYDKNSSDSMPVTI